MRLSERCHDARRPGRPRRITAVIFAGVVAGSWLVSLSSDAAPLTPRFQNLQVLPEDATSAEVFQVMKLMTRALGTECRACHLTAQRNFDSDERSLKVAARAMMHLEQARRPDLSWRDPPATLCLECHQGQLRPAAAPPRDEG